MSIVNFTALKKFRDIEIDISFSSEKKRLVIFGPSGSGKTTVLNILAGFLKPSDGVVTINGETLFNKSKKINMPINKRNIGYLPQEYTLFPNMTIKQNILYGVKFKNRVLDKSEVERLVRRLKISSKLDDFPTNLSGGQKQRVALARILLINPSLILLDEPFSALDAPIREDLRSLILDISEDVKIPIIFVTHDIEEAYIFANDIVVIYKGKVLECNDRDKVFMHPDYVETAQLLNIKNIWEIKKIDKKIIYTKNGYRFYYPENIVNDVKYVCIKPEHIIIMREDMPLNIKYKKNLFHGRVANIFYRGHYAEITILDSNEEDIFISIPKHISDKLCMRKEKKIRFSFDNKHIILSKSIHE